MYNKVVALSVIAMLALPSAALDYFSGEPVTHDPDGCPDLTGTYYDFETEANFKLISAKDTSGATTLSSDRYKEKLGRVVVSVMNGERTPHAFSEKLDVVASCNGGGAYLYAYEKLSGNLESAQKYTLDEANNLVIWTYLSPEVYGDMGEVQAYEQVAERQPSQQAHDQF